MHYVVYCCKSNKKTGRPPKIFNERPDLLYESSDHFTSQMSLVSKSSVKLWYFF